MSWLGGGEGGIRTPETGYPRLRDFQSRSLSQLGHLSSVCRDEATERTSVYVREAAGSACGRRCSQRGKEERLGQRAAFEFAEVDALVGSVDAALRLLSAPEDDLRRWNETL